MVCIARMQLCSIMAVSNPETLAGGPYERKVLGLDLGGWSEMDLADLI